MKSLALSLTLFSFLFAVRSYAPDYESPESVLKSVQEIPLDGSMRETDMERVARQLVGRLNPEAPTDERIVRRIYRILSKDLSPQPNTAPNSAPADSLAEALSGGDRSFLVEWAGKHSSQNKEFLESLVEIARRDKDTPARLEAATALGAAKWKPRDRSTPSPVVQALAEVNLRERNVLVRRAALDALVALHGPGAPHEGDPQIAAAILPASAQSSDQQVKEQMQALRSLGLEKPHVRDVVQAQLNSTLKFLDPQFKNQPFYGMGKQRVSYLLEQLRKGTEKTSEPVQQIAVKNLWDPFLNELATHPDPQIRMEALATQVRFDSRALEAVVLNERPFPQFPGLTEKKLGTQMGKGIEAIGKLVKHATGEELLEGIRILGEFANEHPTASEQLRAMAKAKAYKNDEAVQLAISAALVRAIEAGADGPEIKALVDGIVSKKPGNERFRETLKEAAAQFQPYRLRLLDLQAARPKDDNLQALVSEILTAPETTASLRAGDERVINYLIKRAQTETSKGPHTSALAKVNPEKLSKAAQRKVAEFAAQCGPATDAISQ